MANENLVHGRGDRRDFVLGTLVEGWKAVEVVRLPFQANGAIPTVEQYAELCAKIAHEPSKAMAIRAEHVLDDQQRFEALERLFRKKFELDPKLEARFKRALASRLRALRAGE